jgi:hypothetical protein
MNSTKRDGVVVSHGLTADFILLYVHPATSEVCRVATAVGEYYVAACDLVWDVRGASE